MTNYAYVVEKRSPIPYPKIKDWDKEIVETAGFIPLAVRFKQMEQAGYRARFNESEFSSRDISDMYLNHPEFDITVDDDFEEAQEKLILRQQYIKEVQERIKNRNTATDSDLSESKAKAKEAESAVKVEKNESDS